MFYVCLGDNPINPAEAHKTREGAERELAAYPEAERARYSVKGSAE